MHSLYIHPLVARTFSCCTVCLRTSAHIFMRGSRVPERFFAHLSFLHISPSPYSCLTRLCCSRTVTSRPLPTTTSLTIPSNVLAVLSRPKNARHAPLCTCIAKFGYLARSDANTFVMSPTSSTKILQWTLTRCSSTIRTTISPTSQKPRTRTLANSVFSQCLNPLFWTFLILILLFRKQRKHAIWKPLLDRERAKGKRRFCDQCCRIDVKERLTERC